MIIFDILLLLFAFLIFFIFAALFIRLLILFTTFVFPRKDLFKFSNTTFFFIHLFLGMLFFALFIAAVV